jgi:hypothetical protein
MADWAFLKNGVILSVYVFFVQNNVEYDRFNHYNHGKKKFKLVKIFIKISQRF